MATLRRCEIEGCTDVHRARGYCNAHYMRWRRGERGERLRRPVQKRQGKDTCVLPDCDRPHVSSGLCDMHYQRKRQGDVGQKLRRPANHEQYEREASPDVAELHWIAGFLEGEGCFVADKHPRIIAMQVQRQPLNRLRRYLGGGIFKMEREDPERAQWSWSQSGAPAVGVMLTIYPLLSERRQWQVRRALRAYKMDVS